MTQAILQASNLHFQYRTKGESLTIIDDLHLTLNEGESIAIVGASGSGKSTLLHLLAGLDTPDVGEIQLCGQPFVSADKSRHSRRSKMRNQYMGFVYQFHHLLPEFTAQENVAMPLRIGGMPEQEAMQKAVYWLEQVGLEERLKHKPAELSGGERQRVAIARALVNQPKCLLADEPTGNLDTNNAVSVFNLMKKLVKAENSAMILVTHDMSIARQADQYFYLHQGKLQTEPVEKL